MAEEHIKRTQVINTATGEVVAEKVQPIATVFDYVDGYLFWNRKRFCKTFQDVPFPREMSMVDRGRVWTLTRHVWRDTNLLVRRVGRGWAPMTAEDIARAVELHPKRGREFVAKMVRLGILARALVEIEGRREVHFYLNPIYFFSSNRLSLNLYLLFRHQLDKVLPAWVQAKFMELRAQVERRKAAEDDAE